MPRPAISRRPSSASKARAKGDRPPSKSQSGRAAAAPSALRGEASLVIERGPHPGLRRGEIQRRINAMIELLQLQDRLVSFVLTDDARVHELNKLYRHIDRPTDVLAFAMQEGDLADLAGPMLGDVIVSVPTARKQADEQGASVLSEVTMLLAHGLLHLLGWDHDTPAKDRHMRAETARLCQAAEPAGAALAVRSEPPHPRAAPPRSKVAAKKALILKRATANAPSRSEKAETPRIPNARRSRKG